MRFIKCDKTHLSTVTEFYHQVIEYLETHINYPFWSPEHPSDESIKAAVERGEQYICVDGDEALGAVLLSEDPDGDYDSVDWSLDLKQGEYLSVHVLAVKPERYKDGVGSFMMDECIKITRERGYRSLRLDIVPDNTPAERLYKKKGFLYAGTADLKRETAPIPLFDLYELNIQE